ncbi:MAG: discoidin domain-containing protein [Lachnospiraceae bacterium]|nr:discoidin domain-containing protein [Lachnospiraceae bacterium]
MNRKINIALIVVIVLSLTAGIAAFFLKPAAWADAGVTTVTAPEQVKAQRPPCFPDPEANYIKLPETENLALGKKISSGEYTDVYAESNVNDGKTDTYWESKGFPAEMTIDLGGEHEISTVGVRLNPSAVWEARTQEIAVQVSTDGEQFSEIVAATRYNFDPNTGNRIRIDFDKTGARFVRAVFTMNSSARTGGAQAAEIEVYE